MTNFLRLGVNIDHVATIRNARGGDHPDPIYAATLAANAGADSITAHLREDRRHISEDDIAKLSSAIKIPLNLEIAATEEMLNIASTHLPYAACIVPEKREERTTEGGLDVVRGYSYLKKFVSKLMSKNIRVSVFIEPEKDQIDAAKSLGVPVIELHTGAFALSDPGPAQENQWQSLVAASHCTLGQGLRLHVGHGLTYRNVRQVAQLNRVEEFHIGHSIVSRAVLVGMERAVREMRLLLE